MHKIKFTKNILFSKQLTKILRRYSLSTNTPKILRKYQHYHINNLIWKGNTCAGGQM